MKKIDNKYIEKYDLNDYVWYACYGSNINIDRLMIYINGDKNGKFGYTNGCGDKTVEGRTRSIVLSKYIKD